MTALDTIPVIAAAAMVLLAVGYALGRRERDPNGTLAALRRQVDEAHHRTDIARDVYLNHLDRCTTKDPTQ